MRYTLAFALIVSFGACIARADEVVLNNGDKINGKVGNIAGDKMKFSSPVLGDITIDMKNVRSFSTDAPATLQMKHGHPVSARVTEATTQAVVTDSQQTVPYDTIKQINPPAEKWAGTIAVDGSLTNGNSHAETLGVTIDAALRRDSELHDDRFTLGGAYHFGRQRDNSTGDTSTTTDDWFALGKYDNYFAKPWYVYGIFRIDHDNISHLNYRLTPGAGIGYQWVESPTLNFSTEVGGTFVYEDFSNDGQNEAFAIRFAYHLDAALTDKLKLIHNVEWLPAVDNPADYILNADLALREQLTKNMFGQFTVQYRRDDTPAPGSLKNDLRFLLGVGWTF